MEYFVFNYVTGFLSDVKITAPIKTALANLKRDMENTLLPSPAVQQGNIKLISDLNYDPEVYEIIAEPAQIQIHAADELGFIYGLYYISEHFLGVHPLWFWNDQRFTKRDCVKIQTGHYACAPARVKYRGWFLNDHQLLDGLTEAYQNEEYIWNRIYETVLRLGGNMMIPSSMRDQQRATELLIQNGLYVSHTHNMPLGAETFGLIWPELQASYDLYPEKFEKLWSKAVKRLQHAKVIWNLGYRGNGDAPFWEKDPAYDTPEKRGEVIGRVIRKQMEIVSETVENPVFCTNLYGEITELYRMGYLELPDNIIKIWGDNGYGKMVSRRQDNINPRTDAMPQKDTGKNGMYYHAGFHDLQASNHLTMSPNSTEFLAQELEACFANGGTDLLIVNCGSVKPHVYVLDMIASLWRVGHVNIQAHALQYAKAYYDENAVKIAQLFTGFEALTPLYGLHRDERGAEQFYHYTSRYLIQALMAGCTKQPIHRLYWLTGAVPLTEQAALIRDICEKAIPYSDKYAEKCREVRLALSGNARRLFDDTLWLQTMIHNTGLHGLYHICKAVEDKCNNCGAKAFVHAQEAVREFSKGLTAMHAAEHGRWDGYYQNDSLTNMSTTRYCSLGLRMWLRIVDEGEYFTAWEQDYLMNPHDRRIVCCFNTNREKPDSELAEGLKREYNRLRQGSRFSVVKHIG